MVQFLQQRMNVFIDTCIVNRVLDLEASRTDPKWQEDMEYLKRLLDGPVTHGNMKFIINPTVIRQVKATEDAERREALLSVVQEFKFTEFKFNVTIFPFSFPAHFLSTEQKVEIQKLCRDHPKLARDKKILADSAFNETIDILLTTDRKLARQGAQIGTVKVMLPKELWGYWLSIKDGKSG